MPIIVNLDVMLAKRKMSVTELSERVGITMSNLSILKNGRGAGSALRNAGKAVRGAQMSARGYSGIQR